MVLTALGSVPPSTRCTPLAVCKSAQGSRGSLRAGCWGHPCSSKRRPTAHNTPTRRTSSQGSLERAAALDSTSYDIWYHLGLAYYLTGRFDAAAQAYRRCLAVADSPDNVVAVSDWLWMALKRAGQDSAAAQVLIAIGDSMPVRENAAYYNRLLFYRGRRTEVDLRGLMAAGDLEQASIGYGLANWYLIRGDRVRALELFRQIVDGTYWPAFGFIAAETELQRMR